MSKKENENKNTETPQEQPEGTQSVETVAAADANTGAGTDVDRPEDTPADGEGFEGVTVVIIETNEQHALLAAKSVKKNLRGVDCLAVRLELGELSLPEVLLRFINEASSAGRIVLMTDGMLLLNPVTLADIAVIKGRGGDGIWNYEQRTPVMLHRSVLEDFLSRMIDRYPQDNLINLYFGSIHGDIYPVDTTKWNESCWLLPVVSKYPPIDVVKKWAETQKFLYVSEQSWSDDLVKFLEDRFGE